MPVYRNGRKKDRLEKAKHGDLVSFTQTNLYSIARSWHKPGELQKGELTGSQLARRQGSIIVDQEASQCQCVGLENVRLDTL